MSTQMQLIVPPAVEAPRGAVLAADIAFGLLNGFDRLVRALRPTAAAAPART